MQRRQFLRGAVAGSAIVTTPALLHGCAANQPQNVPPTSPDEPYLDWFAIDRSALHRVMQVLTRNGADLAELYFQDMSRNSLRMQGAEIGTDQTERLRGVGLRVVRDGTVGFAYTEDLTAAGMVAAAGRAAGSGDAVEVPVSREFLARAAGDLYDTESPWSDVATGQKLAIIEKVDALARAADPTVTDVAVSWSDTDDRILIATYDGQLIADQRPMTRLSAQVTMTRGGISHSGFANIAARADLSWYTDLRVAAMVELAVERTEILFAARRPPGGEMPVMLAAGTSGVLLHETVGHAVEADFVLDGKSPYRDALNGRIAGDSVTMVDQATLPNERGALNADDEGTACGRNVVIERGVLRTFLHDATTARSFGTQPTGTGRRQSYRHTPMPRMTCTFMEAGPHDREELIEAMGRGIIADTYTGGNVLQGGGDYRFRVRNGWLVEKGRILMPVRDFDLIGNGASTLRNITMVANDARLDEGGWTCGKKGQEVPVSQGMPSVLVSSLAVEALA